MKKIVPLALAVLGGQALATGSAQAGWLSSWFGPSTYQECVVADMKGQSIYMIYMVKAGCRKKFPCPEGKSPDWTDDSCE